MKIVKPIFIIKIPTEYFTRDYVSMLKRNIPDGLGEDYHVMFARTNDLEFNFECYNNEGVSTVDIEILQIKLLRGFNDEHKIDTTDD